MKRIGFLLLYMIAFGCKAQNIQPDPPLEEIVPLETFNQGNNSGKYFKDLDNDLLPFVGTWEHTNGDITFRLILTKTIEKPMGSPVKYYQDEIEGKFYLIENAGQPNETVICQSERYYLVNDYTWHSVVGAWSTNGVDLGGYIYDNCVADPINVVASTLEMTIVNPGLTAHWLVYYKGGQNFEYSIPTDVMLTKVD